MQTRIVKIITAISTTFARMSESQVLAAIDSGKWVMCSQELHDTDIILALRQVEV